MITKHYGWLMPSRWDFVCTTVYLIKHYAIIIIHAFSLVFPRESHAVYPCENYMTYSFKLDRVHVVYVFRHELGYAILTSQFHWEG